MYDSGGGGGDDNDYQITPKKILLRMKLVFGLKFHRYTGCSYKDFSWDFSVTR
jgi:hypothetical protein